MPSRRRFDDARAPRVTTHYLTFPYMDRQGHEDDALLSSGVG